MVSGGPVDHWYGDDRAAALNLPDEEFDRLWDSIEVLDAADGRSTRRDSHAKENVMTEQPRELGVAVETCPKCGGVVKQVELPDGGVSGEPCPNCFPGQTPVVGETEKASENVVVLREQGTDVTDTKENDQ